MNSVADPGYLDDKTTFFMLLMVSGESLNTGTGTGCQQDNSFIPDPDP
jgi:hypothetical protein